jgi:hypothetical protein
MPNRCHRSRVDVLTHAAKETDVLDVTVFIDEDFSDLESVKTPQTDPGQIRDNVQNLLRLIGVAADTASKWGIDLTRGRRTRGDWGLC